MATRTPYLSNFKDMKNEQKEAIFSGTLKSVLLQHGFIVAEPEPDLGDDFWVANLANPSYKIHRAQAKSAYAWSENKKRCTRRYLVNVRYQAFVDSFEQSFLYFFGLYDPHLASRPFHIGCIPSSFFRAQAMRKRIRSNGMANRRAMLDFLYHMNTQTYSFNVVHPIDVTNMFSGFSAIT